MDARVNALTQVLGAMSSTAVRAAAATSLGGIGTERAKAALLSALQQPDSRVRTAVVEALGNFAKDQAVYSALVNALHDDSSYAVEAAAAKVLGKSGVRAGIRRPAGRSSRRSPKCTSCKRR